MGKLIIKNHIIDPDAKKILYRLRDAVTRPLLHDIDKAGDNIVISCPVHKGGQERKPSCSVYDRDDNDKVEFGKCHCFTCGYTASLPELVADCLDKDIEYGREWLIQNFGNTLVESDIYLEPLSEELTKSVANSSIDLTKYEYYHPYMWKRKLSKEVVDTFCVGYDKNSDMLVFPVWDEHGNLKMLTRRSVTSKRFHIDTNTEKPVYLLNYIIKNNITDVMVVESQINCLYLWSLGYPAIALFGTGTSKQMEILRKSGIRHFTLCFDGDAAGDRGTQKFINAMPPDILISVKKLPRGKDCNDLSKEEFDNLVVEDI